MKRYLIIHDNPNTGAQTVMNERHILGRNRIPIEIEIDAESRQEAIEKFLDSNLILFSTMIPVPMSEFKVIDALDFIANCRAVSATPYRNMKYIQELIGNGNVPDTI